MLFGLRDIAKHDHVDELYIVMCDEGGVSVRECAQKSYSYSLNRSRGYNWCNSENRMHTSQKIDLISH